jgi:hypothetical protein
LQEQHVVRGAPAEQPAGFEVVQEAIELAGTVVQVPGDDGKGDRTVRNMNGRAGGAAAERQRERDEDESRETDV